MSRRFPYDVDMKFTPMWAPFGVRPWRDGVAITDAGLLITTFGFLRLETPVTNVDGAHITRGYRWWTAVGARRSFVDEGVTFGTNTQGRSLHPLQGKGSLSSQSQGPCCSDRYRVRPYAGLVRALGY